MVRIDLGLMLVQLGLRVLVVRPLVLRVVQPFVRLLHRMFVLVLLLLQVFLQGFLNRFGLGIVVPLT
jgi:hypothetical protein